MDRTRGRRTGNPLAGGASVGAPLLSPVTAMVPCESGQCLTQRAWWSYRGICWSLRAAASDGASTAETLRDPLHPYNLQTLSAPEETIEKV